MKDDRGLYYYPNPLNKTFRTYVKMEAGEFWFRLWSAEDATLWEEHDWIPYGAIKKASEMYTGNTFDPSQAYDIDLARALIKEDEREKNRKRR
jgi:hypothetical protein